MTPERATTLAKLRSPDRTAALRTRPGARGWRIELVEFLANHAGANEIIALGSGRRAESPVPSDLKLDRLYVHGDPMVGQKRGIALNSGHTTITNSYIADIKAERVDSQAIAGWNGPGPYAIVNNHLEAAGENILFGGADPAVPGLTPSNIVIRGNTISKPLIWKEREVQWRVKNLLELKNARAVLVEQNLFERNWADAQSGYAILFTVRNQKGGCRWCQVEDVRFERNIVRDVAAGIAILGHDNLHPSLQTNRILIRNNLFDGLDGRRWGGDGYMLQLTDGPRDIVVDHNTVIQGDSGGIAKIEGVVDGFVFTNNVTGHGAYGIIATDRAPGNDTIRFNLPGARIAGNVLAGASAEAYPSDNLFPALEDIRRQVIDFAARDYRLRAASPWRRGSTDGPARGAEHGETWP